MKIFKNIFRKKEIIDGHLLQFKEGDYVEVLTCPRERDGADAYAGLKGTIEKIELTGKFNTGAGSMILNLNGQGTFIATGIINRLKLKKTKKCIKF